MNFHFQVCNQWKVVSCIILPSAFVQILFVCIFKIFCSTQFRDNTSHWIKYQTCVFQSILPDLMSSNCHPVTAVACCSWLLSCFLTSLVSSTSLRALTPASNLATAFYRLIVRTSYDSDPTALFYHQPLPPTINLFSTIRTLVRNLSWPKSWCRNSGKLWTINVFLSLSKWRMWMKQAVELKTRITKILMEIETCQS